MTPSQIRALRLALGETQGEFAARLGVVRRTVQKWELGERAPVGLSLRALQQVQRVGCPTLKTKRGPGRPKKIPENPGI